MTRHLHSRGSAATGPDLPALAAAIQALSRILPDLQIIDTTMPRGWCAPLARDVIFVARSGHNLQRSAFLGRFRQHGGERDLPLEESRMRPLETILRSLCDEVAPSRDVVAFLERIEDADGLSGVLDGRLSLLLPWPDDNTAASNDRIAALSRDTDVLALQPAGSGVLLWCVAPGRLEALAGRLRELGAEPERRTLRGRQVGSVKLLRLPGPPSWEAGYGLSAARLIHDGEYRAESDKGYSWIWTGPSPHFRMLLPVAPAAKRLRVSVIKTEDARNLDELRILLDGRMVPHGRERWSGIETISIELPPPREDMTVLSLVAPHPTPDGTGHRMLGLCLDRLEVTA